ncbi:ATPase PAAT-like isoform X4 [Bos javanicus]|uniref:ATPase PAAT-like isoform X4 n=1 Tax=Bos javanicus TaxID=9906 RepID=UPI002AA5EAC4|nr:ATPase PAAT-like isoform X4 [Bos javanicus]
MSDKVSDSVTPWTVAHQAPLSMGFSRPGCWCGLPFPSPGDLPNPRIKCRSPASQADSLPSEPPGKHYKLHNILHFLFSQDHVILKRNLNGQDENPCFLHLRCDPHGGEEIVSIGILSSARNMEVYLGEEYCGTSRGKNVCNVLDNSEHEKITLYKKCLKLESSTHACKIKLLSFGEKNCVFISKVVVHVRPVLAHSSAGSPTLGSRIDLERVQTIMESMASKLSPGAQQLMNMVRFQQQNCVAIGEQLQSILGNTGHKHVMGLPSSSTPGAFDKSSSTPFPFRTGLTSGNVTEDSEATTEKSLQPAGGGKFVWPGEPSPGGTRHQVAGQHHQAWRRRWGCHVFIAAHGLSRAVASRGYSSLLGTGFSLVALWHVESSQTRD